jgi:hypothetical protein
MGLIVKVRDGATLAPVGQLDRFTRLNLVERWCGVGRWVLDAPLAAPGVSLFLETSDAGIIVEDDATKRIVFSGPVGRGPDGAPTIVRTVAEEGGTLGSNIQIMGSCDNQWLADRVAHPQPLTADPPYSGQEHDVITGPSTSVLLQLIDRNAGPTAVAARQVAGLTLAADPAQGTTITARARWQNLLTYLAELAVAGGAGFEVRQQNRVLTATARVPRDLSADVAFSLEFGNLAGFSYSVAPVTGTAIYAGGQGEGTAREVLTATGSGRRVELFVDRRDLADTTELDVAAVVALAEATGKTSLTIEPIDTPSALYGRHYRLGDIVAVVVDGVRTVDNIQTVETRVEGGRTTRTITVGREDLRGNPALYAGLATLSRRVRQLERI